MIRNIDNDFRLADETEFEEEAIWLERHRIIAGLISPLICLFILSIYLLSRKEVIELMIKQSYGDSVIIFLTLSVFLCCFIENILLWLYRARGGRISEWLFFLPVKIIYAVLFSVFAISTFNSNTIITINNSKVGPQYIVYSEVTHSFNGVRSSDGPSISFRIDNKSAHKYLDWDTWKTYKVGDVIAVKCRKGRLNMLIIEDVEHIEGLELYEVKRLRDIKGRDLTQEDFEEARQYKAGIKAEVKTKEENDEEQEEENTFAEYIKERLPVIGENNSGWMLASFKIEKDGSISNIKTLERLHPTADKALRGLLKGMYRWRGWHQIGVVEKATIKIAYHYGKPQYMFIERETVSDKGEKRTIEDGYTLSDENGNAALTLHEESSR